jgi:hypothetical protein
MATSPYWQDGNDAVVAAFRKDADSNFQPLFAGTITVHDFEDGSA